MRTTTKPVSIDFYCDGGGDDDSGGGECNEMMMMVAGCVRLVVGMSVGTSTGALIRPYSRVPQRSDRRRSPSSPALPCTTRWFMYLSV